MRPEPEHFEEFVNWLREESGLSESTQKSVRKRARLAHSICGIEGSDRYVERLEAKSKYKKLAEGVKPNVKYAVRVYFRFLEQSR